MRTDIISVARACVGTAAIAIVATCGAGSPDRMHSREAGRPEREPPTRAFVMVVDPAAAVLFRERVSNHDSATSLASYYAAHGFGTLALVFEPIAENSVRPIGEFAARTTKWYCSSAEVEDTDRDSATADIVNLRSSGDYSAAIHRAEEALQTSPGSCRLQVEWAFATFWLATVSPSQVDVAKQERAIRTLVTAATEVIVTPEGIGAAQTLRDVARYFRRVGDTKAEQATLLLAKDAILREAKSTDSPLLQDELHKLQQQIDDELNRLRKGS